MSLLYAHLVQRVNKNYNNIVSAAMKIDHNEHFSVVFIFTC